MNYTQMLLLTNAQLVQLVLDNTSDDWSVEDGSFDQVELCMQQMVSFHILRELEDGYQAHYRISMFTVEPAGTHPLPKLFKGYGVCVMPDGEMMPPVKFPSGTPMAFRRLSSVFNCEIGYSKTGNKRVDQINLMGVDPQRWTPRLAAFAVVMTFVLGSNYPLLVNQPLADISFIRRV